MKRLSFSSPVVYGSVAVWLGIGLIFESTAAGRWLYSTGNVHLVAALFALLAFAAAVAPSPVIERGHRRYVRIAAMAMVFLCLAHIIEFLGETRELYDATMIPGMVGGSYLMAYLFLAQGALDTLHESGMRLRWSRAAVSIIALLFLALVVDVVTRPGGPAVERWVDYAGASIFTGTCLFVLWLHNLIRSRLSLLAPFVDRISVATILVYMASLTELLHPVILRLGWNVGLIENVAHYSFYAGLTMFFFAFESFRTLGGVYGDLREVES